MRITYSLFPKFFQSLSLPELAAVVRDVGLDTTNAIVRDGYWITEADLPTTLPAFVRTMRAEGLEVTFATTGYSARALVDDPTPLEILASNGIRDFRLAYFFAPDADVRGARSRARDDMAALAPVCKSFGVRGVYQVHHGTLITSASAAWALVNGLPADAIGVELDPGNQGFEGMEDWGLSAALLGEYLAALGVKDVTIDRDPARASGLDKGWRRDFAPIHEGVADWRAVVRALNSVDFDGPCVFMPFYSPDDPVKLKETLAREVAYLRAVVDEVGREQG